MSHGAEIAYWIGINIFIGVFGPVIVGRTFVRYNKSKPTITLRQFYSKGELGLASLLIALSVIVDVNKSPSSPVVRQMMIPSLSIFAFASALVWAVPLCNDVAKVSVDWKKVWRDSWRVAVVVFSVGLVTEVLLGLGS